MGMDFFLLSFLPLCSVIPDDFLLEEDGFLSAGVPFVSGCAATVSSASFISVSAVAGAGAGASAASGSTAGCSASLGGSVADSGALFADSTSEVISSLTALHRCSLLTCRFSWFWLSWLLCRQGSRHLGNRARSWLSQRWRSIIFRLCHLDWDFGLSRCFGIHVEYETT